jgi:hypothetical protein
LVAGGDLRLNPTFECTARQARRRESSAADPFDQLRAGSAASTAVDLIHHKPLMMDRTRDKIDFA